MSVSTVASSRMHTHMHMHTHRGPEEKEFVTKTEENYILTKNYKKKMKKKGKTIEVLNLWLL